MKADDSTQPAEMDFLQVFNYEGNLEKFAFASDNSLFKGDIWEILMHIAINKFCSVKSMSLKEFLEDFEKRLIIRILSRANGNRKKTARLLGIKYTTLHQKLRKYNINFKKMAY